ncbi:MAG: HAD family hydrolase [Alphaproteobacteria bacterium]|nr:HAD family hydrolase [Alphaproteobacteria bacterium]MCK5620729.1 HAD family hydrolase [Alphaproteobacteria bacterium]
MWSGPRNVSTALLRSWGNRADCTVWDEPLYAHYLTRYQPDHPGVPEIIAAHETDWHKVVETILGPVPGGKAIHYQKHMAHHMLPHIDDGWLAGVSNAFLIRDPAEVLLSMSKVMETVTLQDTGFADQYRLFERVREMTGETPPVIDARDIGTDAEGTLRALCAALKVPFDPAMLSWPPGPRASDGVWAKYWYGNVNKSAGFRPWRARTEEPLPDRVKPLLAELTGIYEAMQLHRLTP